MRAFVLLAVLALFLVPAAGADPVEAQTNQKNSSCHHEANDTQSGGWTGNGTYAGEENFHYSNGCQTHTTIAQVDVLDGSVSVGAYNDTSNQSNNDATVPFSFVMNNDTNTSMSNNTFEQQQSSSALTTTSLRAQAAGNTMGVSRTCGRTQQTTYTGESSGQSDGPNWSNNQTGEHHGTSTNGCANTLSASFAGESTSATWFDGCYGTQSYAERDDWSSAGSDGWILHRQLGSTDASQCGDFFDTDGPAGAQHADESTTCTQQQQADTMNPSNGNSTGTSGYSYTCDEGPTVQALGITFGIAYRSVFTQECDIGTYHCDQGGGPGIPYEIAWPDSPAGPVDQEGVLP
ncbi:MAG: hypothetical protein QOE90_1507 [Thermoplasmata archaeon]|jgi:hypothetical protein|nr:hypothetical protein [Thermoplasmata archaeon]